MENKEHDLKCWPEFFRDIWTGDKTFEIRKDDRGYSYGDTLMIREWTKQHGYSGRWVRARVPYILSGFSLAPNFVCMSIKELERSEPPHE